MGGYAGLQDAVDGLRYKPGWRFWLTSGPTCSSAESVVTVMTSPGIQLVGSTSAGRAVLFPPVMLHIGLVTPDSGDPSRDIRTEHLFAVPAPEYAGDWERWLLDRVLDVERHEAMEFFTVAGRLPFYPGHGPAGRLYDIVKATPGA